MLSNTYIGVVTLVLIFYMTHLIGHQIGERVENESKSKYFFEPTPVISKVELSNLTFLKGLRDRSTLSRELVLIIVVGRLGGGSRLEKSSWTVVVLRNRTILYYSTIKSFHNRI